MATQTTIDQISRDAATALRDIEIVFKIQARADRIRQDKGERNQDDVGRPEQDSDSVALPAKH